MIEPEFLPKKQKNLFSIVFGGKNSKSHFLEGDANNWDILPV